MRFCFFGSLVVLTVSLSACRKQASDALLPPDIPTTKSEPTDSSPQAAGEEQASIREPLSSVRKIVATEELLLRLTPKLRKIARSAYNLQTPDPASRHLFLANVEIGDIRSSKTKAPVTWQSDSTSNQCLADFYDKVKYVQQSGFSFVSGSFPTGELHKFDTVVSIAILARATDDSWWESTGKLQLLWEHTSDVSVSADDASTSWQVASWRMLDFSTTVRDRLMFRDVTDTVLKHQRDRDRARESKHWQYAVRHFYPERRARLDADYDDARFFPISTAYHPGLSVVDVNQDGFDDLYVTVRWGKNMLFLNQKDGTFVESAAEFGLDIEGRSNAAVFADFDNDGDPDVVVARSLERSMYLQNDDGKFVDRSRDLVATPLPYEATSVSVADYNSDGLLDVYFSTYHQDDISRRIDSDLSHPDHRIHRYLTKEQSSELAKRFKAEQRSFVNQVGPPNILLRNDGNGRFVVAEEQDQLAGWRNSFQSSWNDLDGDGDQDLYVANDFARDQLFRNEDGEFRDVTDAIGMTEIGFGMGVSFGDYDNDGLQDLYVSNMYSKAGLRITRNVEGLDDSIQQLANGNYLYRQIERDNAREMSLVSGLSP
ncbi:MAG: VCBS repeat-containing protein, partial [Planctomycetales bacterium]|nr:VCBS repeat-containing protein [Planctomycetales bacterium]